jgi:GNAT superfamily N-acetyltransferase
MLDPSFEPFCAAYWDVRARQLEGNFPGDPMSGVWPLSVARIMRGWGAVKESSWPVVLSPNEWPPKEPANLDRLASRLRCHHYHRVKSAAECCILLGHQISVSAAFEITAQWFDASDGVITMPPSDASIVGSHHVAIVGFDLAHMAFLFRNSWGSDWGLNGDGFMPMEYFDRYLVESWVPHGVGRFPEYFSGSGRTQVLWGVPDLLAHPSMKRGCIHGREIFDASADQRLAWTFVADRDGFLDIEELFVHPSVRGTGIVHELIDAILELQKQTGLPPRLWVSHADWSEANRRNVERIAKALRLQLRPSCVRWAPVVGTAGSNDDDQCATLTNKDSPSRSPARPSKFHRQVETATPASNG